MGSLEDERRIGRGEDNSTEARVPKILSAARSIAHWYIEGDVGGRYFIDGVWLWGRVWERAEEYGSECAERSMDGE